MILPQQNTKRPLSAIVTGAAGFIGSHLVEALLARGTEVVGIDNFDPFYDRRVKERNLSRLRANPKFSLYDADIVRTTSLVDAVPAGVDCIFHLAACAGVRPSIADPVKYYQTNVLGTQNVLELARLKGIPKVIFASSSSIYGINANVPWSEDNTDLQPISPYAATKLSGEGLGHVYSHLHGISFIALRFFTVFGPRQRPDLAIHKFASMIAASEPIPVFGDGSTRRDYTYIDDIVDGILAAGQYDNRPFDIFNLGNDRTISLSQMIEYLEHALGTKAIIDRRPEQPGDVPVTWADVRKARTLLGYNPKTSFRDGIGQFVEWKNEQAK